ncbi:immunity 50 family protein [Hymenobacter sp. DH14]|uniref:Immunity 50 family protein n=1 Tax=Hymenobacter cyanobacteriorum TaxID=2926463 RepID=A0A9X2ADP6_9BACT|nr:Imm50 family immunity protein [Hymenobacter cyanobacteriorum]MCI1186366.1 immunity 50 family protein [Hymenobacter cyanobacteriorum]
MSTTENNVINRIVNSELVVQHFGYWPSFHDATLERTNFEILSFKSTITFLIETAEFTNELNEQGQYKQFKPCSIELQFQNVKDTFLTFDHVPVLFRVDFEEIGEAIACYFSSSAGSHTIMAEQVTVLNLTSTKQ